MTATIVPFHPSDDVVFAVCREMLERWPDAFHWPPQPLAVGLGPVMTAALATTPPWVPPFTTMTYTLLQSAVEYVLEAWCGQPLYLANTRVGKPRVGLDGQPLGKVLREEEDWARQQFKALVKAQLPMGASHAQLRRWALAGLGPRS
jgi:sRNA-binding protein